MPSRAFTSGRKFSTTTSAFLTIFLNAATPSADLRLSVMLRLLRCKFMKSGPSRGPPSGSPVSRWAGVSILMTLAPQSASWRTQVGPERTRVKSSTVKRERAFEARGNGIRYSPERVFDPPGRAVDIPQYRNDCLRLSASAALPQRHRPYGVLQAQDSRSPSRRIG